MRPDYNGSTKVIGTSSYLTPKDFESPTFLDIGLETGLVTSGLSAGPTSSILFKTSLG